MSGNIAFLFPGQGSQFVGMGASFIKSSNSAKERVEEACDTLGFDIGKMILEGSEEDLKLTSNTQPAILLISVIALEAFRAKTDIAPKVSAGHSLGEFSACWAAGSIQFADAIRLVRKRGELMQSAVPAGRGGMAAIIGLGIDDIYATCEEAGGDVAPANFNSPEQTVIAGSAESVLRAIDVAKSKGAKRAISLAVSAPFHTKMMVPAQESLTKFLETITIKDPDWPILRNVDGGVSLSAEEIKKGLIQQVTGCVQWVDSMRKLKEYDVGIALEIGPGKVLGGLMKRIDKSIITMPVGSRDEVDIVAEALING